jgi:hypothetical protein
VRLTCPEAYDVHREVIEWNARFSNDKIPEEAVGVDNDSQAHEMGDAKLDACQLFQQVPLRDDPAKNPARRTPCAFLRHSCLAETKGATIGTDDYVAAGMSMQRFWLTVASQGLYLQPQMTPVIFRWYARRGRPFAASPESMKIAKEISGRLEKLANIDKQGDLAFFAALGNPPLHAPDAYARVWTT